MRNVLFHLKLHSGTMSDFHCVY